MPVVAADPHPGFVASLEGPYAHAAAVTPSDTDDLASVSSAINVTGAGNVKVTTAGGETAVLAFAVGTTRIRVTRVWSTGGTTATGITALW